MALSLAVIAATDVLPAYQRDDWRGIANALGSGHTGRVVVSERFGEATLSVYLPEVHATSAPTVRTREVAYVSLRVRHTVARPARPDPEPRAGGLLPRGRDPQRSVCCRALPRAPNDRDRDQGTAAH